MSPRCRCVLLTATLACGGAEPTPTEAPGSRGSVQEGTSVAPAEASASAPAAPDQEPPAPASAGVEGSAFAAPDQAVDDPPSSEVAEDTQEVPAPERGAAAWRASYSVPVPAELEPYATFELRDLRFRQRGEEWTLDYTLPALLLGAARKLSFRGTTDASGVYELGGDAGSMTCTPEAAELRCDEVLDAAELDRDKLERALAELPAEESQLRRDVAESFANDPIGVLRFAH
ncbi:MAG TPA: hypothetical protein VJU61_23500 [Polyangiaceae bacterium]|nr:hypothetical protein [Polyangiaceae bacterium]